MSERTLRRWTQAVCVALLASAANVEAASLENASISTYTGSVERLPVVVHTMGTQLAGIDEHLQLDAVEGLSFSSCEITDPVFKGFSVTSLQPQGCGGDTRCDGARAILISASLTPVHDGSTIFACDVAVACGTPSGTYPISCTVEGSDPDGNTVGISCSESSVSVAERPVVGDCNENGVVTIGEAQRCVRILLGEISADDCPACDPSGEGTVSIGEVQATVNSLLYACP